MPTNAKYVKELEQKVETLEGTITGLQTQVQDQLKIQLNKQTEDSQYIVKLTKSSIIKIAASVLAFVTSVGGGGAITAFNYVFDLRTADLKRNYEDKIYHLQKELDQYKEASTTGEKRIKELIDANAFLKLQSSYDKAEREYSQSKTDANLKQLLTAQEHYVRYIKFKKLQDTKVVTSDNDDFNYFSDKAKLVDGQAYPIPNDVLLKMKEEKLDAETQAKKQ
jgi:hypothetical protein